MVNRRFSKKRSVIKRVYEKGDEKTFFAAKARKPSRKAIDEFVVPKKIKRPAVKPVVAEASRERQPFVEHYELPVHYGTTRLTLMVKDPFWLYAYWEIARGSIESLRNTLTKEEIDRAKTILRMYDITLVDFNGYNANSYFDIEVGNTTNNWYVNLWCDNASYVGEIGLRCQDGRFFSLARSNYVNAPRVGYSPRAEQIWMRVEDKEPASAYVVAQIKRPLLRKASLPLKDSAKKRAIYLTEDDIRNYYSELSPWLRDIISSRLSKLEGRGDLKYKFVLEGETKEERQAILSRLPKDYFLRKLLLGASEELVLGASERLVKGPGGASDFVGEKVHRHFFFDIATELIVYGRTEPGAEVWLGNKKVELRHDGTFTLRFALPDGKIPLEFRAVSPDQKETKKINTYVERSTHSED